MTMMNSRDDAGDAADDATIGDIGECGGMIEFTITIEVVVVVYGGCAITIQVLKCEYAVRDEIVTRAEANEDLIMISIAWIYTTRISHWSVDNHALK
ncbi:hypothetical protein KSS87_018554 [Heliosperma pusillum]|nr:hypothetical protein KSS87_018554 [Heliosperma pusillum]